MTSGVSRAILAATLGVILCAASRADATIPEAAKSDPLYAKGYLVVTYYPGVYNDGTHAASTTAGLNEALVDAYNKDVPGGSLVAYFPAGTYLVNDTLKAWTQTGLPSNLPGYTFATPRNHLAVIGSTAGAQRPLIKLASGSPGFGSPASPKYLLEFRNFDPEPPYAEQPAQGYHQMLRGVNLDCNGNTGAVGLYFSQAQDSSIDSVKVNATGAVAGIKGLPARGWGAVHIEVEGGRYGIDTVGTGNAGSTLAAITLRNQTISAVRHDGFVPLAIVGFDIVTPSGSAQAALTIEQGFDANGAGIILIDGRITLGAAPGSAAIDNANGKNFYARNVYVTGGNKLVRSGGLAAVQGAGTWKRIDEYSYCDQSAPDNDGKQSFDLLDGVQTKTPAPGDNGEVVSIMGNAPPPPSDLISRHRWGDLPSVDDPDVYDPVDAGIITMTNGSADVSSVALQSAIDNLQNKKIFLRKGIYRLDGTITLRKDTVLFGAARFLTRIEVNGSTWNPTSETPMITTVDDVTAMTSLSDVTIGVDATDLANDWFVALDWRAGRRSMVYMGQIYREPAATNPVNRLATQPHSLIKIRESGGGRWYFAGSRKAITSGHAAFRILKVTGTSEPLWFYGLNLEHPGGCDSYAEFLNTSNIRIYGVKTEFSGSATLEDKSVLVRFSNVANVAQFGLGAIRNAVAGQGCIEFVGTSTRVLATLIAPQVDNGTATGDTLRENFGASVGVAYPNVVALYKRGEITAADEAAMTHSGGSSDGGDSSADAGVSSDSGVPADAREPADAGASNGGGCAAAGTHAPVLPLPLVLLAGWLRTRRRRGQPLGGSMLFAPHRVLLHPAPARGDAGHRAGDHGLQRR